LQAVALLPSIGTLVVRPPTWRGSFAVVPFTCRSIPPIAIAFVPTVVSSTAAAIALPVIAIVTSRGAFIPVVIASVAPLVAMSVAFIPAVVAFIAVVAFTPAVIAAVAVSVAFVLSVIIAAAFVVM
jgi:hypothetical protein